MEDIMKFISDWGGIIVLLIIAVIGIIGSLAGSTSAEERQLNGQDAEHYVLRQPVGRVVKPLILLIVGVVAEFVLNFAERLIPEDYAWTAVVAKLAVAVIFGFLFWSGLANVIRRRVFVNGDKLVVTPAFGHSIETNYTQIRTVANKMAGGGGVVGKKIRTKEGNRFEVLNSMSGYDQFCTQLDAKVELPNLARRLFKGKDKKTAVHEETWEKETGTVPPVLAEPEGAAAAEEEMPLPEADVKPEPAETEEVSEASIPLTEAEIVKEDVPPAPDHEE